MHIEILDELQGKINRIFQLCDRIIENCHIAIEICEKYKLEDESSKE